MQVRIGSISVANSLFIGITTSNSGHFIGHCLDQIKATTSVEYRVMVIDNDSTDNTKDLVIERGAEFICIAKTQGDALNYLFAQSGANFTLLIHADTILLSNHWFETCLAQVSDSTVLVSPEDIGCGPMTREFGRDQPESSFLFFHTSRAKRLAQWRVRRRRYRIPLEIKHDLPFYGPHVTHELPQRIKKCGLTWKPMNVHSSRLLDKPWYSPTIKTNHWDDRLASLEYGLGNFYSVEGHLTHYHNWYDRIYSHDSLKSSKSTGRNNDGFPTDFVRAYSQRFLHGLANGHINLPAID